MLPGQYIPPSTHTGTHTGLLPSTHTGTHTGPVPGTPTGTHTGPGGASPYYACELKGMDFCRGSDPLFVAKGQASAHSLIPQIYAAIYGGVPKTCARVLDKASISCPSGKIGSGKVLLVEHAPECTKAHHPHKDCAAAQLAVSQLEPPL